MGEIWSGEAEVVGRKRLGPDCWKMVLKIPTAEPVAAGQFCHLRVEPSFDPLLRRPFSYWDTRRSGRTSTLVTLVYTVVGRGTEMMARKRPGARMGYMGPLGKGFTPGPAGTSVLVAGGAGIVPFHLFARQSRARRPRPRIVLIYGGRTASRLCGIGEFRGLADEIHVTTEDGSRGRRGLATDLLEDLLPGLYRRGLMLYACGPEGMTAAVARIARREGLPCEVSLERRMGCGLGACGACVTKVAADGGAGWRYSRICCEGPTYDAARLVLE